jgi:hypothetical protein
MDHFLRQSAERERWEKILWATANKTHEEAAKGARRAFMAAILFGMLSMVFFLAGLCFAMQIILNLN